MRAIAERARAAGRRLAVLPSDVKNGALRRMVEGLVAQAGRLLEANASDVKGAQEQGHSPALVDRLRLDPKRIQAMADGLCVIAELRDPVGEIAEAWTRPNGLRVQRVRIPLGVIAMIYEARPHVTAEAAALCVKSGNAVILRGGREALHSNRVIVEILQEACDALEIPAHAIQLITDPDYALLDELLTLDGYIDLVIPRGGEQLIEHVCATSRIPVLKHAKGVCHVYVDAEADLAKAEEISLNSKVQRPGVCNAMETLLVHERIAPVFLPPMIERFRESGVEIRGCAKTRALVPALKRATEEDWSTEYLDLIVSVRVVSNLDAAVEHIERHGSQHTDAIVTENKTTAEEFARRVNSSAVLVNASTRFNDGGELGLGAEIGISTSKLHAFGPMGLRELTTLKYVVLGDGQVRS
jgi:glutamate-5-semialdehyde dehydrogenase